MGGVPWMYFVAHEPDVQGALDGLKEREFRAGRYYPVMEMLDPAEPAPSGAGHASIEAAREAAADNGTRSILDMDHVATGFHAPVSLHDRMMQMGARMVEGGEEFSEDELRDSLGFGVVSPVSPESLLRLYGTETPSRRMVEEARDFLHDVERGTGVYIVLYDGATPTEICFAGYSYD